MSSDRTRVAMVGCGGISAAWLKPMAAFEDVEVVGLVDLDPARAEKRKQEFGLANAETGSELDAVLAACRPDAVFDCTLPEAHYPVTMKALAAGCHVLGEKPMADTLAHAREMTAAARKSGRTYAVIQNRRYQDDILRFRDLVQSGEIGPLTTLNADFYLGCHFGGFRDQMEHVLLLDMAIHSFDEARLISGRDPVSVYCHEWNPRGSWYTHGASAVCVFELADGAVFTYRGSWCAEGLNTSWECAWRAVGSQGSATWDGRREVQGEARAGDEGFQRPHRPVAAPARAPLTHKGHAGVIREFLDCLRNGKAPQTHADDNIRSFAMVEAAVESARCGRKVAVAAVGAAP